MPSLQRGESFVSEQNIIEAIDLKKYFSTPYGLLHAVDGVSISIAKGQTLGVVGESGCGKSTLGRVMIRLLEASSGEVRYKGEDMLKADRRTMHALRTKVQMIFQDPYSSLNPRLSVFELIAEPVIVTGLIKGRQEIHKKVLKIMETVGLAERLINVYPHELDGGRRQRIGVARALILEPELIVCDEPVSALDVSIQAQILNLLMDLQDEMGLTYMFITHDLSVVRHISTEIAVMYLGQVVEKAPSKELFRNPLHPYTMALLDAIPRLNPRLRDKPLKVITGEVPSPINPKEGCRFAPRCEFFTAGCNKQQVLEECSPGHMVLCSQVGKLKERKNIR
jgi:peptide/nickel transport system ATP-binding protein